MISPENNFINLKINDYTDFYLKISKKSEFSYDPYDRWCDVIISIANNNFNYKNNGELLLEYEVVKLRNLFGKCINNELKKDETLSFIEPDLEFEVTNDLVNLKVNLFQNGALSMDYYNLCFDKDEIIIIYEYISNIFSENEEI